MNMQSISNCDSIVHLDKIFNIGAVLLNLSIAEIDYVGRPVISYVYKKWRGNSS